MVSLNLNDESGADTGTGARLVFKAGGTSVYWFPPDSYSSIHPDGKCCIGCFLKHLTYVWCKRSESKRPSFRPKPAEQQHRFWLREGSASSTLFDRTAGGADGRQSWCEAGYWYCSGRCSHLLWNGSVTAKQAEEPPTCLFCGTGHGKRRCCAGRFALTTFNLMQLPLSADSTLELTEVNPAKAQSSRSQLHHPLDQSIF